MSRGTRVVRIYIVENDKHFTIYKVMTGTASFVNSYRGLASRPNAFLAWHGGAPLGQRSLVFRLIAPIKKGIEIVIAYGAGHRVDANNHRLTPRTSGPGGTRGRMRKNARL